MIMPVYNGFHPILQKKTNPITHITDDVKTLIKNMFETLYNIASGVGLAANQVGSSHSLFIVDVSEIDEYADTSKLIFINPEIISYSSETDFYNEGCLSFPAFYEDVERPIGVTMKYYDVDMNEIKQEFSGFLARVVQHEYDHLQGIVFYEKLSSFRKTLSNGKLKKIKSSYFEVDYDMISPTGNLISST